MSYPEYIIAIPQWEKKKTDNPVNKMSCLSHPNKDIHMANEQTVMYSIFLLLREMRVKTSMSKLDTIVIQKNA